MNKFAGGNSHHTPPPTPSVPSPVPVPLPPSPTITPIPTSLQSPPQIPTPSGNGQIWCSGPSTPGYNVSTGKCVPVSTTTNAIVPKQTSVVEKPQSIRLDQLPNTGTPDDLVLVVICFSLVLGVITSYYSTMIGKIYGNAVDR